MSDDSDAPRTGQLQKWLDVAGEDKYLPVVMEDEDGEVFLPYQAYVERLYIRHQQVIDCPEKSGYTKDRIHRTDWWHAEGGEEHVPEDSTSTYDSPGPTGGGTVTYKIWFVRTNIRRVNVGIRREVDENY